jgi:hypothetical protein
MRTLSDIQERILKEEFPNISFESDIDVERYFELRNAGRQSEALSLYNNRLVRKYPDEAKRTLLLRYYRSHDPRYRAVYKESLESLADTLVSRTRKIIEILTKDIDAVKMTDAYAVIKMAEGLLSVISPDRYVAISFTEKYVRYAKVLDFRFDQMERTAELIRLYVTDTIESVQEFKRERDEQKKVLSREQKRQRARQPTFDLSRIVFSQEDIARIIIPQSITRTEDIVVAYCLRYWNLFNDQAFEKTIFLYSRKYKTRHHDIFQAIKNGRQHGWKDEEILNAVLANVITGYYYSISGDIYLQRTWARMKESYQIGGTPALPQTSERERTVTRTGKKRQTAKKAILAKKMKAEQEKKKVVVQATRTKQVTPFKKAARVATPAVPATPAFVPNSIADIIRKMTGKTYTVYKELFFKGIRPSIRTTLSASSTKRGNIFDNKQNDAEELVYRFLFDHYSDPYQNWKDSAEKTKVEAYGYVLPEIEPIIARWIKDNR